MLSDHLRKTNVNCLWDLIEFPQFQIFLWLFFWWSARAQVPDFQRNLGCPTELKVVIGSRTATNFEPCSSTVLSLYCYSFVIFYIHLHRIYIITYVTQYMFICIYNHNTPLYKLPRCTSKLYIKPLDDIAFQTVKKMFT